MEYVELPLRGVQLVRSHRFDDRRGYFMELFKEQELAERLEGYPHFVQDNLSCSHKGVFRGMHTQTAPFAQAKLVRCISGRIVDFAMDVDPLSATFGRVVAVPLTPESGEALYIPDRYAHGFLALEEESRVLYKVDAPYAPDHERAYNYRWQPLLDEIAKYIPIDQLIVSDKDKAAPELTDLG
ncbi:MAG: dTDP-4-dehydrorhamnose 3,5-epimerase family protein [Porphyromonas sp.]|nr:dTDP-4-dehydrorhamnose 3,5-epimerase family protein [Porphyromonas sp.]